MSDFRKEFIAFCIDCGVLRFGQFKTKAGRMSPYFFNAGLFNDGAMLGRLGQFYAKAVLAAGQPFDMLFGPAYKGIPLAASVAIALAQAGHNAPYSFNRKETKDHGEGGRTIGAPLAGQQDRASALAEASLCCSKPKNLLMQTVRTVVRE